MAEDRWLEKARELCPIPRFTHEECATCTRIAEGLRAAMESGVSAVLRIRCVRHRATPQMNFRELDGCECAACAHEQGIKEGERRERRACLEIASARSTAMSASLKAVCAGGASLVDILTARLNESRVIADAIAARGPVEEPEHECDSDAICGWCQKPKSDCETGGR